MTDLLREREAALSAEVEAASARLAEVRSRLRSIEKGHEMTMNTLELAPLPVWRIQGLTEAVLDESEIGGVARQLAQRVLEASPGRDELLYVYYGSRHDRIEVTVGVELVSDAAADGLGLLSIEAVQDAVAVRLEDRRRASSPRARRSTPSGP